MREPTSRPRPESKLAPSRATKERGARLDKKRKGWDANETCGEEVSENHVPKYT